MTATPEILHASTVAVDGKGILIRGPSGSGKSSLAIELVARGAGLVSDDRTRVWRDGANVLAEAPDTIAGLVEARGVGLIRVPDVGAVPLRLVIDMGQNEMERLPHPHTADIMGLSLPCLHKAATPHFPGAVLLYIRGNL